MSGTPRGLDDGIMSLIKGATARHSFSVISFPDRPILNIIRKTFSECRFFWSSVRCSTLFFSLVKVSIRVSIAQSLSHCN